MDRHRRVVVVDDGRLNRECLVAQLRARGFDACDAWDLPSLFAALDAGAPEVMLPSTVSPPPH